MKKKLVIGFSAGIISLGIITGCGQQSKPQLTPEQKKLVKMQKDVAYNKKLQAKVDKALEGVFKTGTVKNIGTPDNPQQQWTFTNNTDKKFNYIQLAYHELDKNGEDVYGANNDTPSYSPEAKNIKPNQSFTVEIYASQENSVSLKPIKLTGSIKGMKFRNILEGK